MLFKSFQAVVSNVSLQMRVSSSPFNAEPPIRKPSTSGSLISSTAFFEDTEPPYRIRTVSPTRVPNVSDRSFRIALAASCAD